MPKTKQSAGSRRGYLNSKTNSEQRQVNSLKSQANQAPRDTLYQSYVANRMDNAAHGAEVRLESHRRVRNGDRWKNLPDGTNAERGTYPPRDPSLYKKPKGHW